MPRLYTPRFRKETHSRVARYAGLAVGNRALSKANAYRFCPGAIAGTRRSTHDDTFADATFTPARAVSVLSERVCNEGQEGTQFSEPRGGRGENHRSALWGRVGLEPVVEAGSARMRVLA